MKRNRKAFTLVEMIIVVAVIAVIFALAVPRFAGNKQRRLRVAAEQVADVLTMYAQRESLSNRAVGLWADPDRNEIGLMVLDMVEDDPEQPFEWRVDPLVRPVQLPSDVFVLEAKEDGHVLEGSDWQITSTPGVDRAMIEIALEWEGTTSQIVLPPTGVSAIIIDPILGASAQTRSTIDLDAEGASREVW